MRRLALVLAVTAIGSLPTTAWGEQSWTSFALRASAYGADLSSAIPGAPLKDDLAGGHLLGGRAVLDGRGTSWAEASGAAAGDSLWSVRGIAATAVDNAVPVRPPTGGTLVPDNPTVVTSSHPSSRHAAVGPFVAESTGLLSTATAGSQELSASVSVRRTGPTLVATARTEATGLTLGPVTLGHLLSSVSITRVAGGAVRTATDFALTGVLVNGVPVEVGPQQPLHTDRVSISINQGRQSPTRLVAPSVEIRVAAPVALLTGGSSEVVLTVGRSEVSSEGIVDPAVQPVVSTAPAVVTTGPSTVTRSDLPGTATVSQTRVEVTPGLPATTYVETVGSPRSGTPGPWDVRYYLPLVLAGVVMTGGLVWVRRVGVRGTWTS